MAPDNSPEENPPQPLFTNRLYWIIMLLFGSLTLLWLFSDVVLPEITWKEFEEKMFAQGDVSKLDVVNNESVEVYIKQDSLYKDTYNEIRGTNATREIKGPHYIFTIGSVDVFHAQLQRAQEDHPSIEIIPVSYIKRENWISNILMWIFPLLILFFIWTLILRRASAGADSLNSAYIFGKSKARITENKDKNRITFDDVAGLEEAKEEIYELVKFLKDPEKYMRLGAKIPKGVLLAGPPGTGKTLLAKAVAGEAGVPFLSLSGSEFIEMFVGVGAARVRDLFKKAKTMAPSIIFIDEIDTIGRARGKAFAFQSNDERESTLNQLLAELDGFDTSSGVIVLAATNRGDVLDPALLRPGRFDRHIHLELPNLKEREAIFKVHMKPLIIADELDVESLAGQTPGFSGADIANICNEAALIAARNDKEKVEKQDFMDAIDRVVGGLEKRSKIISKEEKRRIAIHESGHVVSSWYLEHAHPVLKVSIIPRGKSLGSAWYLPEEHEIMTEAEFLDIICYTLGGRAAEELIFGDISSNAIDDLEKVAKLAYNMVVYCGMGEELPNLSYYDSSGRSEQAFQKPFSEKTAEKIDNEIQKIINQSYARTLHILTKHKKQLNTLAETLIEKEVVYKEQVKEILGERKFEKGKVTEEIS